MTFPSPVRSAAATLRTPSRTRVLASLSALVAMTVNGMRDAWRKSTIILSSAVGSWRISARAKTCAIFPLWAKKSSRRRAHFCFSACETRANP